MEKYLEELKREMKNCDPAIIQDALNDTKEHFTTALAEALAEEPETAEPEILQRIISDFGTPAETAESYIELEKKFGSFAYDNSSRGKNRKEAQGMLTIFRDTAAWGAVLYSLLSLATGILYFTWAVVGISLSASLLILIIGIPVSAAFFMSFRGFSFLEGRIIEGLLGVRMPRRPRFYNADAGWQQKLKVLLLSRESWLAVLYFILMLPLGILYFTLTVVLFSVSIAFMASPFAAIVLSLPVIDVGTVVWGIPPWTTPVVAVIGFFILKGALHLLKRIGKLHGSMAKAMLVPKSN